MSLVPRPITDPDEATAQLRLWGIYSRQILADDKVPLEDLRDAAKIATRLLELGNRMSLNAAGEIVEESNRRQGWKEV